MELSTLAIHDFTHTYEVTCKCLYVIFTYVLMPMEALLRFSSRSGSQQKVDLFEAIFTLKDLGLNMLHF